jgi:hypothetical protein
MSTEKTFRELVEKKFWSEDGKKRYYDNLDVIKAIVKLSEEDKLKDVKSKDFMAWAKLVGIQREVRGMNQNEMYHIFSSKVANVWRPKLKEWGII